MEGVANRAIVHANYYTLPQSTTTPLLLFRPAPPMAAIDRFLHGRAESADSTHHHFSLLPPPPPQRETTFPSSSSTVEGFVHRFSPSSSRDDDVDADGGTITDMAWPTVHDVEAVVEGDDILVGNSNTKRSSRRDKGPFIKGQWTDYEDSKLVELVKKYGTRKWSQIAMKLVGRAGKQCRERWHNHLRPDIKKDSWDEKEERLLVEAHLQFGNKWAEIARRIPGRSENSIKNHWNATKRRQNSKRKSKKKVVIDPGRRTSMLQKYIKSLEDGLILNLNNFIDQNSTNDNIEAANVAVVEASPAPPSPDLGSTTLSGDPSSGQLCYEYNLLECSSDEYYESSINIDDSCHDEVVFMQNLFNTNNVNNTRTVSLSLDDFENRQLDTCNVRDQAVGATTSQNNLNNANNYSDWMVYSLLEGAGGDEIMTSNDSEQSGQVMAMDERYGSGGEWKDMDLYELVSANYSQF